VTAYETGGEEIRLSRGSFSCLNAESSATVTPLETRVSGTLVFLCLDFRRAKYTKRRGWQPRSVL